jgi:hypothetical protein
MFVGLVFTRWALSKERGRAPPALLAASARLNNAASSTVLIYEGSRASSVVHLCVICFRCCLVVRNVQVEAMGNKTLAVDASIWIHQVALP